MAGKLRYCVLKWAMGAEGAQELQIERALKCESSLTLAARPRTLQASRAAPMSGSRSTPLEIWSSE